jgi:hypothetical protein
VLAIANTTAEGRRRHLPCDLETTLKLDGCRRSGRSKNLATNSPIAACVGTTKKSHPPLADFHAQVKYFRHSQTHGDKPCAFDTLLAEHCFPILVACASGANSNARDGRWWRQNPGLVGEPRKFNLAAADQ